jgi:phage terminase large subunit
MFKNNEIKSFGAKKYAGCIIDRINLIKTYNLHITSSSVNTIKEFRNYSYIKTKDNEYLDSPIDNYNHSIDAIGYCCQSVLFDKRKSQMRIY